MKTSELIRRLQEADPTGDAECVVGCEDIFFVEPLPAYYDGRPLLLVHDESLRDKCFSVVGARFMGDGPKVRITTLGLEDLLIDNPELPIEGAYGHRAEHVEAARQHARDVIAKVDAEFQEKYGRP